MNEQRRGKAVKFKVKESAFNKQATVPQELLREPRFVEKK
jgi:hypothetical protein